MALIFLGFTAIGCGSVAPSHQEIEEAVWVYIQEYEVFGGLYGVHKPYADVEAVEVIQVGDSYKAGDTEIWPVRVYLVRRGSKELHEYDILKNVFGEWVVWWFTAGE